MSDTYTYNQEACSKKDVDVPYAELWTLGQQEAIRRLSLKTKIESKTTARYELVGDLSARADRIAANYARIYLELEKNGKPEHKGRFYWTGLAAFASKQVRCALDFSNTKLRYLTSPSWYALDKTMCSLGKGNFWLFQDIFVWHWFYINYPTEFYPAARHRNWDSYIDCFTSSFNKLPWAGEALPKIKNLAKTKPLLNGFKLITEFEKLPPGDSSGPDIQLASLMEIANHEQREILQPLIYDDWIFQTLLDGQAKTEWIPFFSKRLASMSTACEKDRTHDITMKIGDLYNPEDRMKFIEDIATKHHRLMQHEGDYMHQSLETIARWGEHA